MTHDVNAPNDGEISFLEPTQIVIEHADGWHSVFVHVVPKFTLKIGDKVKKGQRIGTIIPRPPGY